MLELFEALGMNTFEVVITAFVGFVFWKLKKEDDKKDNKSKAKQEEEKIKAKRKKDKEDLLLGLARILLINKMQESLDRGFTTQADYEVISALYDPYRELGGNGAVEHLFEDRYKQLKVKEHE